MYFFILVKKYSVFIVTEMRGKKKIFLRGIKRITLEEARARLQCAGDEESYALYKVKNKAKTS